jgi:serine phosphatase RsbU (regulator of sigma subunit)
MFSDGFADQFGGEKGKKFKYKPFRELLISASKLAVHDQKKLIHQSFNEWKWSHGQVDDILIVGIRYTTQ